MSLTFLPPSCTLHVFFSLHSFSFLFPSPPFPFLSLLPYFLPSFLPSLLPYFLSFSLISILCRTAMAVQAALNKVELAKEETRKLCEQDAARKQACRCGRATVVVAARCLCIGGWLRFLSELQYQTAVQCSAARF